MLDANMILQRHARMKAERANFESLWQEVASLLLPRQADFIGSVGAFGGMSQGLARTERIFDETAMQSLDHGCAVFEGEVIPVGAQWQAMQALDPDLMKNHRVRTWYERKTAQLFALRNSAYSGWGNQTHESVASLLSFGLQGMWTDIRRERGTGRALGLGYRSEHIGQIYIEEDHQGRVDIVHREFKLTHRQAIQKWGDKAPEVAKKAAREQGQKRLDESAEYVHVLQPNASFDPGREDAAGKRIASCYLSMADREIFDVGGYRVMPLVVSRYEKSPTETYGRCPAINVLPAVRATQAIMRDLVTAIEFMARPALGAVDDMLDQILNYEPGGVSYGAIDQRGNQLVKQLFENPDIAPARDLLTETRIVIKRAFFEDLYSIRQEQKTHVSATDVMDRMSQRGLLLAPLQRQETEWFTPQADREIDLMGEMGMLDDMPPEVIEAGGLYQTVYENPLARARKADAAAGYYQMLQGVTPLMQLDPANTVPAFFQKYPFAKVLDGLGYIHGVPASWEASDEERQGAAAEARALADKAKLLEVGAAAAGIAKDMSAAIPPEGAA